MIASVWSSPAHGKYHVCSPIVYPFAINKLFFSLPYAKQLWWLLQQTKIAKVAYNESVLQ